MAPAILPAIVDICRRYPLRTGVLCAGAKGAAADALSQQLQRGEYKPERTVAFALWNAMYCGVVVCSKL